jgi:hypothetical protein
MPRTIPPISLAELLAQETSAAFLGLVTITDQNATVTRLTTDSVDTNDGTDVYTSFPFDMILPFNIDGQASQGQLILDNVSRQFVDEIRSQTQAFKVNLKIVSSTDPSETMAQFVDYEMRQVSYNAASISGALTMESYLNEPVGVLMTGINFPGLFYQ